MKVSVIIPAYKTGFLLEAVDSILGQTFADFELIIVNDGSPFDVRKSIEARLGDGRIVYIEQENQGVAAARNRGLAGAKGEYLAFLDDDDYWPPDKLEWQVRELDGRPEAGMVIGRAIVVGPAGEVKSEQRLEPAVIGVEEFLMGNTYTYTPGQTLMRRTVLGGGEVFDGRISGADDFDVYVRMARRAPVVVSPRLALYYRRHPANANSAVNALKHYEQCEKVIRKNLEAIPAARRSRVACKGMEWLYDALGKQAIRCCKNDVSKGNTSGLWRTCRMVGRLMVAARHDWKFLRRLCVDVFVPVRFRKLPAE